MKNVRPKHKTARILRTCLVERDLIGDAKLLETEREKYLKTREMDEISFYEEVLNLNKNIGQRLLFEVYGEE